MNIIVKTFSCNYETYKRVFKDVVTRVYKKNNVDIGNSNIILEKVDISGKDIYAQRSNPLHSRTLSIYEDGELKYIVGLSNTNYDYDKQKEVDEKGGKYVFGKDNYHANTYIPQGINNIFEYYFDLKKDHKNLKLYFYLLDTDQSYASNKTSLINYRKLATIGYEILNLDCVSFNNIKSLGFSLSENIDDIKYVSFNKLANDLLSVSKKNSWNKPSYIKCVDENYDILKDNEFEDEEGFKDLSKLKYIYTFKGLSAEQYDSFLNIWALSLLAEQENKTLEFLFVPETYNFRLNQASGEKITKDIGKPLKRVIEKAGLNIVYETTDEVLQQMEKEKTQYETAKANGIIRNQELFKNNIRAKGIETKCYLCGCEVEEILEAAHLWGVSEIKNSDANKINNVLKIECMKDLIDKDDEHSNESFYKKYMLANSGDNGIWLCANHHDLFDRNYYCFDSEFGKILVKKDVDIMIKNFLALSEYDKLLKDVMTDKTKVFLGERENMFKSVVSECETL